MSLVYPHPLDEPRFQYLCGLMALPELTAMEFSVARSLAYTGKYDNSTRCVRRSLRFLAERAGRDGKRDPSEKHPFDHRGTRRAFKQLWREHRVLMAARETSPETGRSGRGHRFNTMLCDSFPERRQPKWPHTPEAARRMSMQVSPVGPTLEQTYFQLLWALDRSGQCTGDVEQWAVWLRRSPNTALRHLRALDRAGICVSLVELPKRGRERRQYRVTVRVPPRGELPSGAFAHAARMREEQQMVRELAGSPGVQPSAGPPIYDVGDEDLPDDLFDAAAAAVSSSSEAAHARRRRGAAAGKPVAAAPDRTAPEDKAAVAKPTTEATPARTVVEHAAVERASAIAETTSATSKAVPTTPEPGLVVGVQLTLDGGDGQRLTRRRDGSLRYEPPRPAERVVRTTVARRSTRPIDEDALKTRARLALFAPRDAGPSPSLEDQMRELGVELETA